MENSKYTGVQKLSIKDSRRDVHLLAQEFKAELKQQGFEQVEQISEQIMKKSGI